MTFLARPHSISTNTWKVLQSSGSICRVFRLLSIGLVSFASRHRSVFSQALDSLKLTALFSTVSPPSPALARSFSRSSLLPVFLSFCCYLAFSSRLSKIDFKIMYCNFCIILITVIQLFHEYRLSKNRNQFALTHNALLTHIHNKLYCWTDW